MTKPLRPHTTLIISQTADGCLISSDASPYEFNQQWKNAPFIRALLQQFFELTNTNSSAASFISASMLLKAGIDQGHTPAQSKLNLVVYDPQSLITPTALEYLIASTQRIILIRPGQQDKSPHIAHLRLSSKKVTLSHILHQLASKFKIKQLFIQSAGIQNKIWFSDQLLDDLSIITHPVLAGTNGVSFILPPQTPFQPLALRLIESKSFDQHYLISRYRIVYPQEFQNQVVKQ